MISHRLNLRSLKKAPITEHKLKKYFFLSLATSGRKVNSRYWYFKTFLMLKTLLTSQQTKIYVMLLVVGTETTVITNSLNRFIAKISFSCSLDVRIFVRHFFELLFSYLISRHISLRLETVFTNSPSPAQLSFPSVERRVATDTLGLYSSIKVEK